MNLCKLSLLKKAPPLYNEEEHPQKTHLTLDGSEGLDSPSTYHQEVEAVEEEAVTEEAVAEEVVEEEAVEEEAVEEEILEIKMIEVLDKS